MGLRKLVKKIGKVAKTTAAVTTAAMTGGLVQLPGMKPKEADASLLNTPTVDPSLTPEVQPPKQAERPPDFVPGPPRRGSLLGIGATGEETWLSRSPLLSFTEPARGASSAPDAPSFTFTKPAPGGSAPPRESSTLGEGGFFSGLLPGQDLRRWAKPRPSGAFMAPPMTMAVRELSTASASPANPLAGFAENVGTPVATRSIRNAVWRSRNLFKPW